MAHGERIAIRRRSKVFIGVDLFGFSKNSCTVGKSNVADRAANSNNFFRPLSVAKNHGLT
jgi:hypothetical protein